jgi:hypothetical protein
VIVGDDTTPTMLQMRVAITLQHTHHAMTQDPRRGTATAGITRHTYPDSTTRSCDSCGHVGVAIVATLPPQSAAVSAVHMRGAAHA